jgi:hypothetical protein
VDRRTFPYRVDVAFVEPLPITAAELALGGIIAAMTETALLEDEVVIA